ncbi:DUF899 family protein [Immundisolibacter sp.]
MGSLHDKTFPGESAAYRAARDTLLAAEAALRQQIEAVAALRRALPPGGAVPRDYPFLTVPNGAPVLMSGLFAPGTDTLVVYSYMYSPQATAPCPLCTSMLDSLDGAVPHLGQHVNLAVVARAPVEKLDAVARQRGWRHLRLLSAAQNTYQPDYLAEDDAGNQWPMLNVFRKTAAGVLHTWGSELLYVARPPGLHSRHVDLIWPLWNVLDVTPAGRSADWLPRLHYP